MHRASKLTQRRTLRNQTSVPSLVGYWWAALFVAGLIFLPSRPANAEEIVQVEENRAEASFPDTVTFYLEASGGSTIERVTLRYGTDSRTCQLRSARQLVDLEPAESVNLQWEWDLERSGVLPPGAEVWWQWEIETAADERHLTPVEKLSISDQRFNWQEFSLGGVAVQWYDGGQDFGRRMLDIAVESLDRLVQDLGVRPEGEILILIYADVVALQEALIHTAEWTGGVAFPEYNTILIGVGPDEAAWGESVIPHELAHLVVETRVFNCEGVRIPTWLSEGLAVLAEGPIGSEETSRVLRSLGRDTLPRLASLAQGFSAYSDRAALSYAQSGLVVSYLVERFGPERMDLLLSSMQSGQEVDAGLQRAYGLDTDELDDDWREEMGFPVESPAAEAETPSAPTALPTSIPTLAPLVVTPNATSTRVPTHRPSPAPPPSDTPTPLRITTERPGTPAGHSGAFASGWSTWGVVGAGVAGLALLILVVFVIRSRT